MSVTNYNGLGLHLSNKTDSLISLMDPENHVITALYLPALVQIMAWHRPGHYLNQWWLIYWCIYVSLGLNELTQDYKRLYIYYLIISWYLHVRNGVAVAAYSRLASQSQAKFHTKKMSPLVRPCAAAPAQSTTSAHRSLDFRRATSSQRGRW